MNKVLVVDDDIALRGMLGMALESKGFTVIEAGSANKAIAILQADKEIYLVVLDMGMPPNEHLPTEGIKVLNWITDNSVTIKTIVLTGQEADATSYQAVLNGAFDFFEKPVEFSLLLNSLKRADLFNRQMSKIEKQEKFRKIELKVVIGEGVKKIRDAAELKLLKKILHETNFNVHHTGRVMGLKRENIYYLIKKYGLDRNDF